MKGDKLSFILKLISAILFIITLAIIISNLGNILSVFGNRPKQSLLNEYLQNVFKLNTIFYILVLIITYLTLRFNNLKYIFIFAPFLFLDLLLFGKLYILFIIVIYCICSAILRRKMHFKYIYFSILLLASFTVLRTYLRVGYFEISFMTQMLGEFLNTWEVGYLIQSSTKEQDFLYTLGFFFLRALPSPYISIFFDDYISYTAISTAINPLDYGLAGNLIAESLAFKSNFLLIVAPILFCCFFFIISFLPSLGFISTNQLYILYCIQLLPIFRYSFYELALYPIYLITTFGFLFIFIDLAKKNAK
ncbi:hypothetical protein [Providencia sp. M-27]|uniref:hypothetical protein n=1 Tax=Providencia sp. M-27 TaxID=2713150 RepID=UPI00140A9940|nr:hypothetical protein [Providencia sp. M-27]